jgi:hypothetical protein
MGYKVLGYLVWRGGKWYIRKRVTSGGRKKLAFAALAALAVGGAIAAQRAGGGDSLDA